MDHFSDVILQGSDKVKGPGHHSELIRMIRVVIGYFIMAMML